MGVGDSARAVHERHRRRQRDSVPAARRYPHGQVREELAGHRTRLEELLEAALKSFAEAGDPAAVEAELPACAQSSERSGTATQPWPRSAVTEQQRKIKQIRLSSCARPQRLWLARRGVKPRTRQGNLNKAGRELAEDQARRARAEQTRAEREATTAVEAGAKAEAEAAR